MHNEGYQRVNGKGSVIWGDLVLFILCGIYYELYNFKLKLTDDRIADRRNSSYFRKYKRTYKIYYILLARQAHNNVPRN